MAELLFIATTIFVAYVLFVVMGGDKKEKAKAAEPDAKPITPAAAAPVEKETKTEPTPAAPVKPAAKPSASKAKATSTAKKAAPAPTVMADNLKNPKTGEVTKAPNNYAFAKRWIKEALVEEGLLDKIYKNNELDAATSSKIHDAIQQLRAMEKYQ